MDYRVGDIVHVSGLGLPYRDKKYCVFVAVSPYQFFLINSENRKMYDCIPLEKNGRSFPKHDSFIACSRVFEANSAQIDSYHGRLADLELEALIAKVESSNFLTGVQKRTIVAAIAGELIAREDETQ